MGHGVAQVVTTFDSVLSGTIDANTPEHKLKTLVDKLKKKIPFVCAWESETTCKAQAKQATCQWKQEKCHLKDGQMEDRDTSKDATFLQDYLAKTLVVAKGITAIAEMSASNEAVDNMILALSKVIAMVDPIKGVLTPSDETPAPAPAPAPAPSQQPPPPPPPPPKEHQQ